MGIDPGFELRESDSQDHLETLSGAPDCRQLAGCAASLLLYVRPEGLTVDRCQSLKITVRKQRGLSRNSYSPAVVFFSEFQSFVAGTEDKQSRGRIPLPALV